MPAVFVHGVPDTPQVWDAVIGRLGRKDVVTLSLPGFGCALPPGFGATKEAYIGWLLAELAALEGPIDLVGHDWGGLLVVRAVSVRPGAVRSWAAGAAPLDREYVWHQAAQTWQTPGKGEKVMAAMTAEAMQAALAAVGVPAADAAKAGARLDATMKQCILALYRSAVNAGAEWEDDLARVSAPGLVLWGEKDPFASVEFGARLAGKTRARFVSFPGSSHWWQLERPAEVAAELERFWASPGRG
jgi:pimeloyl-ACP methyl ester carboxylesterase